MMAWAIGLSERGEVDKARHVAARLKEFRNPNAAEFFAPCEAAGSSAGASTASGSGSRPGPLPFQCLAPTRELRFEDFR